jgi:NADP-dependent alcohol dehydrogenase
MNNFDFKNPTKIIFGKGKIAQLPTEIPKDAKILMLYGGGSIKKNGIYEQVKVALHNHEVLEFGGIPANPEYEVLIKALDVIKKEDITYLLAVGGGSVIDGTKFLASAALFKGEEPWDILSKRIRTEVGLPFGTVLTLPATGSEMNSGAVVTRKEIKEKLSMGGPGLFPQFSIMDPEVIKSIPKRQIANGLADSFTHVMEQYMTYNTEAWLQDRFAESIMETIIEVAPKIMKDTTDYDAASNFMWSCTMALNGLIQKGVACDWAIHMMGHELTALYGIDHARTLAIVAEPHYKFFLDEKLERLAQFGERVWKIKGDSEKEIAEKAIEKMVTFFHSLEIDTKLSSYTPEFEGTAEKIAETFKTRGWVKIGERQLVTPDVVTEIIKASY